MKKILLSIIFLGIYSSAFAAVLPNVLISGQDTAGNYQNIRTDIIGTVWTTSGPANSALSITDTSTSHTACRGVWVGTTQGIDLYVNGGWITFQGAMAGSIIPVVSTGARITAGSASPLAGDVVFLY